MRSMRLHALGEPLRLDEVPPPQPGPGQALLRVRACGVNFADTLMVKGTYQEKPALPFAPGLEVGGEVIAVGAGVDLAVGTRVAATTGHGGMAEQALAPAAACTPIPDAMPFVDAAALPVAYGTSQVALDYKAGLEPGERLLVLGAAGGVGLTAVEIGNLMGAEVIACARGAEKLAVAKAKGADHLIDAEAGPDALREQVKALGGADVVYDPVGGAFWKAALRAANPEARLLPLGFASGEVPQIPANILLVKNLTVIGFYWGSYYKVKPS
ncbi:MAG: NADPH:quinone oxidoreductase family protein, partial [Pseudomonadota bacterium]